jgi:hypothetical protein
VRPQSFTICLSIFLFCASWRLEAAGLAPGDSISKVGLSAEKIHFDPATGRFVGEGDVMLTAGKMRISAALLSLDLESGNAILLKPVFLYREGLELSGTRLVVNLKTSAFKLESPELKTPRRDASPVLAIGSSAACQEGICKIMDARATACPHRPTGYHIRADEILIHQNGDYDLKRPVLEVDGTDVAAIPWIRLRTGNASGFLPPRLGWDSKGGLVAGPAGHVPLGENAFAEGHAAVRTSQGFESRSALHARNLDLRVDHLFDAPTNLFRFGGETALPLRGASLNTDVDIVTNRQIIDDLAIDPLDRALTHTTSRGLLAADVDDVFIETYAELLQSFDAGEQISKEALTPRASVELGLAPLPISGFFWPTLSFRFTRFGMSSPDLFQDASQSLAPGHSRLEASYGFFAPGRAGPVNIGITAAGRHQAWLPDSGNEPKFAAHLGSAEAHVTLPLARRFKNFYHGINPYIRYRITPWLQGGAPSWTIDDFDRLRRGQGMEAGLSTALTGARRIPIVDLDLWERIDLPGF